MAKLVFLGPPGAGKGTQAKIISKKFGIPHISTGDIFRTNITNLTELGKKAKGYNDKGMLVPDEITNEMVKQRLNENDCINGFILDGYPRTVNQADYLAGIIEIDKVINFELSEEEVIKRISGRRTCKGCGAMYHISFLKPKIEGKCDKCSGELAQREDEKPDIIKRRLEVYRIQTEPLINYYIKKGNLVGVDAFPVIDEVTRAVEEILIK